MSRAIGFPDEDWERMPGLDDPKGLVVLDEWDTPLGDRLRIVADPHGPRRLQRYSRIDWVDETPRDFAFMLFGRLADCLEAGRNEPDSEDR